MSRAIAACRASVFWRCDLPMAARRGGSSASSAAASRAAPARESQLSEGETMRSGQFKGGNLKSTMSCQSPAFCGVAWHSGQRSVLVWVKILSSAFTGTSNTLLHPRQWRIQTPASIRRSLVESVAPYKGRGSTACERPTLVTNLTARREVDLHVPLVRPVRAILAVVPHLGCALFPIGRINALQIVKTVRLTRRRNGPTVGTDEHSQCRIRVREREPVDDEFFVAAKTTNATGPNSGHNHIDIGKF